MNYKKLIEETYSVRNYTEKEISEKIKNEIIEYFKKCKKLNENIKTKIEILNSDIYEKLNGKAGYNGMMIKSPNYIIISSERENNYIENSGFIASDIILKATELGVNTCFITMSDRKTVSEILKIDSNMEVTALISLGYKEKENKNISNNTKVGGNYSKAEIKIEDSSMSSRKELDELVFSEKFGNNASIDELLTLGLIEPLKTVLFAPSALNSQPWRFILNKGKIYIAVENNLNTSEYDKKISLGALMNYFQSVFETDFFGLKWNFDIKEAPEVPENFKIEVYCIM